jgi:hypothetical protein
MMKDANYYYFLQKLETEYLGIDYSDLEKEFLENKWEFHGVENSGKISTYRWQFQKRQFVLIVVDNSNEKIKEVIL